MGWIRLNIVGVKNSTIKFLMNEYKSYEEFVSNKNNFTSLKKEIREKIYESMDLNLNKFYKNIKEEDVSLIDYTSDIYPKRLKNTLDPPLFIYVKGKLKFDDKYLAIVGTRKSTNYGEIACNKIIRGLKEYPDVSIISGLALGIDSLALEKALELNINCLAVVGSGLDIIFPYENKNLWKKIENQGTIISEYPLGTPAQRWNFPRRNRIISGLSNGVIVCESYKSGGSLITAELAFESGRDVFAVPGFINYPSFEGCNNLIKSQKAKLIQCTEDICEEFLWEKHNVKEDIKSVISIEEKVLDLLITEKSLDQLILNTNMYYNELISIITTLRLKGYIKETSGGRYVRI